MNQQTALFTTETMFRKTDLLYLIDLTKDLDPHGMLWREGQLNQHDSARILREAMVRYDGDEVPLHQGGWESAGQLLKTYLPQEYMDRPETQRLHQQVKSWKKHHQEKLYRCTRCFPLDAPDGFLVKCSRYILSFDRYAADEGDLWLRQYPPERYEIRLLADKWNLQVVVEMPQDMLDQHFEEVEPWNRNPS